MHFAIKRKRNTKLHQPVPVERCADPSKQKLVVHVFSCKRWIFLVRKFCIFISYSFLSISQFSHLLPFSPHSFISSPLPLSRASPRLSVLNLRSVGLSGTYQFRFLLQIIVVWFNTLEGTPQKILGFVTLLPFTTFSSLVPSSWGVSHLLLLNWVTFVCVFLIHQSQVL